MQTVETAYFRYGDEAVRYLSKADPLLGTAMKRIGCVERETIPDLFAALIYAIIGQLISTKSAWTIWMRMQAQFGEITAEHLASESEDTIQRCGMTMKKAVCICENARLIADGQFDLDELRTLPDEEVVEHLCTLKGVGRWTAEMLLIHSMERPDVVSWGDIAIKRGMCRLYGLKAITKQQFETYRCRYSPFGSVASIYLWHLSSE
nr:DNA-3-methyladenine glycosylase [Sporolactobacillus pectinivorans]